MKAVFVELPAFEKWRPEYLSDDQFREFQLQLMSNPEAGEVIRGTGGMRKVRFVDARRGKGKRGGLRVIYYWWAEGAQFWLFTLYDKDEASDLTPDERKSIAKRLKAELAARSK